MPLRGCLGPIGTRVLAKGGPGCQVEERGSVRSATQHCSCSMNNGATKPFHQKRLTVRPGDLHVYSR